MKQDHTWFKSTQSSKNAFRAFFANLKIDTYGTIISTGPFKSITLHDNGAKTTLVCDNSALADTILAEINDNSFFSTNKSQITILCSPLKPEEIVITTTEKILLSTIRTTLQAMITSVMQDENNRALYISGDLTAVTEMYHQLEKTFGHRLQITFTPPTVKILANNLSHVLESDSTFKEDFIQLINQVLVKHIEHNTLQPS